MDPTTVLAALLGFGLVLFAMTVGEGELAAFIDVPALLIVIGGTLAVTLMSFRGTSLWSLFKALLGSSLGKPRAPAEEIERIVEFAAVARRDGLLGLDSRLQEIDDGFFSKGLQLVVDGVPPETVRSILRIEAEAQRLRHAQGKRMLEVMGALAPAFGMIGTLVGIVQMLQHLSEPANIGGGLATALLALLYGTLLSNMLVVPLSAKLEARAREEALLRELMVEGILSIQSGEGAQLIKERLKAFLAPRAREALAA